MVGQPSGFLAFVNMVRPHGAWDLKEKADCKGNQDYGNFHFGVVASAFGIPAQVVLRGTGALQVLQAPVNLALNIYRGIWETGMKVVGILKPTICVLAGLFLSACLGNEEVNRVTSPDGALDAVLEVTRSLPTVSDTHHVYVVKKGESRLRGSVFHATHVMNIDIRWREVGVLEIVYDKAAIERFRNNEFLRGILPSGKAYYVEIRLVPTSPYSRPMHGGGDVLK
jgi:hypothetical protein